MKLVFLGPPGAGKGTQASRVAEEFGLRHASTGAIFREAVAQGSELGAQVRSIMEAGKLVPDDLTSRVVREMVLEKFGSFILDGYPRTIPQAETLDKMLSARGEKLDAAVQFELDGREAFKRLTGRLMCARCGENFHKLFMPPRKKGVCDKCGGELVVRSDSSNQVVRKRMAEYEEKTAPLVAYYRRRGLLKMVDASQEPETVTRATQDLLKALTGK